MTRSNGKQPNHLSTEIRRQIRTTANKSYLRSLPLFKVDPELPEPLDRLLGQIDRAERRKRPRSRG